MGIGGGASAAFTHPHGILLRDGGDQLGPPALNHVLFSLRRRRPTPGARRGARAAISASPAVSTSVRWRPSWWECGAASAWRTCPTNEHPTATQPRRCPCPHAAQHRSSSVPSSGYPSGGTPVLLGRGRGLAPGRGPRVPTVLTQRLGAAVRAWGVRPMGFTR